MVRATPTPDSVPMSEVEKSSAQKSALRELVTALIATAITLVVAIAIYLWVPNMQLQMRAHAEQPGYTRNFSMEGNQGRIAYRVALAERENPAALEQDLQLLKRRFERGQFQLATVSVVSQKKSVEAMQANQDDFNYALEKQSDGADLIIQARSAGAAHALEVYIGFLRTSWKS